MTERQQQEPTPEQVAELDAAREEANRVNDDPTRRRMFELVLGLPAWKLLTDPESATKAIASGGIPTLLTLRSEKARLVPIFSTSQRASAAAAKWGVVSRGEGATCLLTMDVRGAVGFVSSLDESVEYFMIDLVPDELDGFGLSIDALPSQYDHHVGTPPIACLDRMARLANRLGQPPYYLSAYRVIATLGAVYLPRMKSGAPALMPHEDKLICPMFTDERGAASFAESQPDLEMFACPPADLPTLGEQLAGVAGDKFIGMIANPTGDPLFVRLDWFAQALGGDAGGAS
jgi:hypothetical protein